MGRPTTATRPHFLNQFFFSMKFMPPKACKGGLKGGFNTVVFL